MMTTHQIDALEDGGRRTWMDTSARLEGGLIVGRTRIWTTRRLSSIAGAVRVVAVDDAGTVLGFTGERSFRVGGRQQPWRSSDRTVEWSSALFADSLDGAVRIEVMHYRPAQRGMIDRALERS
jgi:hypothetical protein